MYSQKMVEFSNDQLQKQKSNVQSRVTSVTKQEQSANAKQQTNESDYGTFTAAKSDADNDYK